MQSTTTVPETAPQHDDYEPDRPQQLELAVFATVDAWRGVAPEKALWREAVEGALETIDGPTVNPNILIGAGWGLPDVGRPPSKTRTHAMRPLYSNVSKVTVIAVAWTLYARAGKDGTIRGFSMRTLARKLSSTVETVGSAIAVLVALRLLKRTDNGRRRAPLYALNLGTLDWPAVKARARGPRVRKTPRQAAPAENLPFEGE